MKMQYYFGLLFGKSYRIRYWKKHNNSWHWGITLFIKEVSIND
jgi:hypothetical protein